MDQRMKLMVLENFWYWIILEQALFYKPVSKDRKSRKVFNTLDWLARLVTHIPGRYEQTVSSD
jgi:hypothetical protein